ncbi:uncharacterized protein G2W53_021558 [Senna tora]|uniref:Uncharacterized protein n=1 Tax=Senna tora TaxID=362788 RepID=A0A834WNI0_9FABA|nr:uncharacterized protein G2W53_021558 [Senna tora]
MGNLNGRTLDRRRRLQIKREEKERIET